jgi:hypothetical protein
MKPSHKNREELTKILNVYLKALLLKQDAGVVNEWTEASHLFGAFK